MLNISINDLNLKSYRYLGEEAEALGKRLDSARNSLNNSKNAWAEYYWQAVVDRLMFQWQQLPVLHDADAQMSIIPRWTIDYKYFEQDDGVNKNDIGDRLFEKIFREPNLDASWERERDRQIIRARAVL